MVRAVCRSENALENNKLLCALKTSQKRLDLQFELFWVKQREVKECHLQSRYGGSSGLTSSASGLHEISANLTRRGGDSEDHDAEPGDNLVVVDASGAGSVGDWRFLQEIS